MPEGPNCQPASRPVPAAGELASKTFDAGPTRLMTSLVVVLRVTDTA